MQIRPWIRTLAIVALLIVGTGCAPRVTPHVLLPQIQLGEPSFFPTVEAYTATPVVGGNTVDLLLNGEEIFPAIMEAIRGTTKTITYAQYYYEDGPVARDIAEALAERFRAGVGVNVLLDAVGSLGMPTEYVDVMGSTNLDNRSFANNDELNIVVYDRQVARRLEQIFTDDLTQSRRVTYDGWRRRPMLDRLLEMLTLPIRDQL